MDENQHIVSKESKSQNKPIIPTIGEYVVSSVWKAVVVFAVIGFLVSNTFRLTMNSETWFWFFSSIAQTFAALVALVAIFLISRLDLYNAIINKNKDVMRTLLYNVGADEIEYFDDNVLIKTVDEFLSLIESEPELKPDITDLDLTTKKGKIYLLKRAREENNHLEQKKEHAKKQMWILLEHTVFIIMLSIILLPFGSLTTEDSSIMIVWIDYKLKWAFIFGVAGLCIATLYKIESLLNNILSEKE
ncbi:MAG: hypothetical protein O8C64_02235 [Candidatus Methanoperedens sp.]|nr:hypothetical protein [Candidatus Methanoperedens sp.]MCZ7406625.1 hypothetical protein [Candidatus Methanoperedens sp.]